MFSTKARNKNGLNLKIEQIITGTMINPKRQLKNQG